MKTRKMFGIMTALLCLLLGGVPLVYAAWYYADLPAIGASAEFTMSLGLYDYPQEGMSHTVLIASLIGGEDGLNNPDSYLNQQLALRERFGKDTLGSMAALQGDQLNEIFNTESQNLSFIIQSVDADGDGETDYYYIFTTDVQLGSRGSPAYSLGTYIEPIYRTTVVKDSEGQWVSEEPIKGKAPSTYYSEAILGTWNRIPSFNTDLWVPA